MVAIIRFVFTLHIFSRHVFTRSTSAVSGQLTSVIISSVTNVMDLSFSLINSSYLKYHILNSWLSLCQSGVCLWMGSSVAVV